MTKIVRVSSRVLQTCVSLQFSDGRRFTCDDVTAIVRRVGYTQQQPKRIWTGCQYVTVCGCGCHGHEHEDCSDRLHSQSSCNCGCNGAPTLEYPAFSTDTDGRVCFHWDFQLYGLPPGRYDVLIVDRTRKPVGQFQIELVHDGPFVTETVSLDMQSNCGMCE